MHNIHAAPTITLTFDGSSDQKTHAGAAAVIYIGEHITTAAEALTVHRYIGPATNNVAEYSGLILGLQVVRNHCPNVCKLIIKGDSELVLRQMDPLYSGAVSDGLKPISKQARTLLRPFQHIIWGHTWGHEGPLRIGPYNKRADTLAEQARQQGASLISVIRQAITLRGLTGTATGQYVYAWIITPPAIDFSRAYAEHFAEADMLHCQTSNPYKLSNKEMMSVDRILKSGRGSQLRVNYRLPVPFATYR